MARARPESLAADFYLRSPSPAASCGTREENETNDLLRGAIFCAAERHAESLCHADTRECPTNLLPLIESNICWLQRSGSRDAQMDNNRKIISCLLSKPSRKQSTLLPIARIFFSALAVLSQKFLTYCSTVENNGDLTIWIKYPFIWNCHIVNFVSNQNRGSFTNLFLLNLLEDTLWKIVNRSTVK